MANAVAVRDDPEMPTAPVAVPALVVHPLQLVPVPLLATTGASAASRFSTTGCPWARVDDVVLAPTATGFLGSAVAGPPTFWDASLSVTASRSYGTGRTWAGAGTVQSSGTGTSR